MASVASIVSETNQTESEGSDKEEDGEDDPLSMLAGRDLDTDQESAYSDESYELEPLHWSDDFMGKRWIAEGPYAQGTP